jgi:hypothetical protein
VANKVHTHSVEAHKPPKKLFKEWDPTVSSSPPLLVGNISLTQHNISRTHVPHQWFNTSLSRNNSVGGLSQCSDLTARDIKSEIEIKREKNAEDLQSQPSACSERSYSQGDFPTARDFKCEIKRERDRESFYSERSVVIKREKCEEAKHLAEEKEMMQCEISRLLEKSDRQSRLLSRRLSS